MSTARFGAALLPGAVWHSIFGSITKACPHAIVRRGGLDDDRRLRGGNRFGLAALLVAHVTAIGVTGLWRPRPATGAPTAGVNDQDERGLAFPYASLPYYLLAVTVAIVVVLAAGFAVLMAADGTGTGWALAVVGAAAAAFLDWFLIVLLCLAPGTLVVTPSGIYHRSLVLEHFVPWEAIVDVLAREGTDPWITVKALPMDGTRQRRHTGRLHAFEGQALPFLVAVTCQNSSHTR